ncbi:MAG: hypothetical protein U0670_12060 [Anaerolineae bacterium]
MESAWEVVPPDLRERITRNNRLAANGLRVWIGLPHPSVTTTRYRLGL